MRGLLFAAVAGDISAVPDQAPQVGAGAGRFLSKIIRHVARAAAELALTDFVLESSYGASVFALVRELIWSMRLAADPRSRRRTHRRFTRLAAFGAVGSLRHSPHSPDGCGLHFFAAADDFAKAPERSGSSAGSSLTSNQLKPQCT